MRVIAGKARGTKLFTLEGINTRPTLDRVKESIFSSIQYDLKEAVCIDAFAGSGGLGIEALSRGASHVDFCDNDRGAVSIIKKNLDKTNMVDFAKVYLSSVFDYILKSDKKYDFVFLDPPYGKGLIVEAIKAFLNMDLLSSTGVFVCEHEKGLHFPEKIEKLQLIKQKHFSKTSVSIYKII